MKYSQENTFEEALNTTFDLTYSVSEVICISNFWKTYNECQSSEERTKMIQSERSRLGLNKNEMAPYGNF